MTDDRWKRIECLVDGALGRPPETREAYVREACAGDADLQREVESLLRHVDDTTSLLATPAPGVRRGLLSPSTAEGTRRLETGLLVAGRYVVEECIGQGGMGEVYRAHDRQLGRAVAIKAIHPRLAASPEAVRRLTREARFAASLDHPFICRVHEIVHSDDGQTLVVMEHVEGQTLKAVLEKGPLDLKTSLRMARELAEAMSVAHARGLVHRDIKPANVMLTPHGHAKVMDFGVARPFDNPDGFTSLSVSSGQIVGTPAYMAPEQAAGGKVDHRSDIFSFGIVLYECLAGTLPFEGPTSTAYLRAAALGAPKPLPKHVPAELRRLVLACLEKTPDARPASFDVIRAELETAAISLLTSSEALTPRQRMRLAMRPWVAAALVLIAIGAGYAAVVWRTSNAPDAQPFIAMQQAVVTWPTEEDNSRISPDGSIVAFVSTQRAGAQLWLRSADGKEPSAITATHEAIKTPAWSPDGRQVAYLFRQGTETWLQTVSLWGEPVGAPRPMTGAWDDLALVRWIGTRIYFGVSSGTSQSVLWRVSAAGGPPVQVTHVDGVTFTTSATTVNVDIRSDESRIVFSGGSSGLWISDLDGRNASRLPVSADLVVTPRWKGQSGEQIVYLTNENGQADLWEYDLNRRLKTALTTSPLEEEAIDVSATGDIIVADSVEQTAHLWAIDPSAPSSSKVQLTNDSRSDLWPSTASSSDRIVFHRRKGSFFVHTSTDTEIVTTRWTHSGPLAAEVVASGTAGLLSPDGRRVLFLRSVWANPAVPTSSSLPELWVHSLNSPRSPVLVGDSFWFAGTDQDTWAQLARNAIWAPNSNEVFFVRRAPASASTFEVVRAALGADLTPSGMSVLHTGVNDERFADLAVSQDGRALAVVVGNRRPYRGGTLRVLDLSTPDAPFKSAFTTPVGTQLHVTGWTKRGTIVALVSPRPDGGGSTEVWDIDPRKEPRRVGSEVGLVGWTGRLDVAGDRLFATTSSGGLGAVRVLPLNGETSRIIESSAVEGITFGGYAITVDGWLLYMRKSTNRDVWIFEAGDR
jgi:serine/threonine protein kinase/Tol biopolymer transport system component